LLLKSGNNDLPRIRVSITLPKDIIDWIDLKIEERTYHNRSHAIEVLIKDEMKHTKDSET
jgi:Predicted transcriptional regulators containing the CopG/Arc/MetJ DNA-binding domain and a metal-binding domain